MAAHLCKTDLQNGKTGAARYPMIADGSHYLIIKKKTSWTNKEMIATPKEEYFAQVVTRGFHSDYGYVFYANEPDALTMQRRIGTLRDSLTVNDWTAGHRPMFQYWARGFCPHQIKYDTYKSTEYWDMREKSMRHMELCAVYKLLGFDLYAFPCGKASSFKAYWRIWNGSAAEWGDMIRYMQPTLHNNANHIYYRFSNTVHPPSFHRDTSEFGVSYGVIDTNNRFNQGLTIGDYPTSWTLPYDPWNVHDGTASGEAPENKFVLWGQENSTNNKKPYYVDIEITGNGLTQLKKCLASGKRVWAHLGYSNNDAQSSVGSYRGQSPYTTLSVYCSRIELRIVASMSSFNT